MSGARGGVDDEMDEDTLIPEICKDAKGSSGEDEEKEVQDFVAEKCPRSDVYERRLEASDKCRNDGNDCFRRGDSDLARQYYLAALYHVDFDIGQQWQLMDAHIRMVDMRKVLICSNLAAVFNKLEKFKQAQKSSELGLKAAKRQIKKKNSGGTQEGKLPGSMEDDSKDFDWITSQAKLHYRRGLAFVGVNDHDRGADEFQEGAKLGVDGGKCQQEYAKCKHRIAKDKKVVAGHWQKSLAPAFSPDGRATEVNKGVLVAFQELWQDLTWSNVQDFLREMCGRRRAPMNVDKQD